MLSTITAIFSPDCTDSGTKTMDATKSESEVPKGKVTYEELMAEQRRKAEELEKKSE